MWSTLNELPVIKLIQSWRSQSYGEKAIEIATKLANVTDACENNQCSLNNKEMLRADVVQVDNHEHSLDFWAVHQKRHGNGFSINLSWRRRPDSD